MKKSILKNLSMVVLVTSLSGCRMLGLAPSDEKLIRSTAARWKAAMLTKNLKKLTACYSDNYTSSKGDNKESMSELMKKAFDSSFMDDVKINMEKAQVIIVADKAKFGPIDFISDRGVWPMELTLQKEKEKWLITGSEGLQQ